MKKKTILVTGATGGIGKATAMILARQGHRVIIHGRNAKKVEETLQEIVAATGNHTLDALVADLLLLEETRRLAGEFKKKYDRLDVLINNAGGIMNQHREVTREGFETTLAINLFSPFLLTSLLMDRLAKSDDARIINVSSSSHRINAKPDFNDLQLEKQYNPLRAYGNAKLFLIWVTQHLAERLAQNGMPHITANSLHPGAVATNFGLTSNLGGVLNVVVKVMRPFFRSADEGSDTLVYLATADEVSSVRGKYFVDRKLAKTSVKYYSPEHEKLVWEYCNKITGAGW